MKKSILFWTVIVCVLYLAAHWLLNLNGLEFRIWIREPVTLLIAAGAFAGMGCTQKRQKCLNRHLGSFTDRVLHLRNFFLYYGTP